MIYFDNAATTLFKPEEVYQRSDRVFRNFSANAGRSGHMPAIKASEIIFSARLKAAQLLGIQKAENVIFTFSCTDALNMVIQGLFGEGDHIIATVFEHNSVLRPLEYMKSKYNIEYTIVAPDDSGILNETDITKNIKNNTKAIIVNYVSNVTGHVQNVELLCKTAHDNGLIIIADCAQAAGVQEIAKVPFDYICCAGHKGLYGPQGLGILGIKNDRKIPAPLRYGGTGTRSQSLIQPKDLPEYLESGTQSVQNIGALECGIDFVLLNKENIQQHEISLAQKAIDGLSRIKNTKLYSPKKAKSGVVSFNIDNIDSVTVADILDKKYSICTRGGFHCAPLVHRYLGTQEQGAVRISFSYFNTIEEVEHFLNCVENIK